MAIAAIAVVAATIVLHAGRVPAPLDGNDMPGWRLEETCRVSSFTADGATVAPEQRWLTDSGAVLHVRIARFDSAEAARAACEYEAGLTSISPSVEPALVGDAVWRWPAGPDGTRWVIQHRNTAVSLHVVGPALDLEQELHRIATILVGRLGD